MRILAAIAAAVLMLSPALAQDNAPATLPGGASSLQETYQDWSVACGIVETGKTCAISQQQNQQNGQRVLAIELRTAADGAVNGTLLQPFGLLLESGVTLQIDDQPDLAPLRFRTCLPAGCIVQLAFDSQTVAAFRAGTVLKLKVIAEDGRALPFSVSLKGGATALDRLVVLMAS